MLRFSCTSLLLTRAPDMAEARFKSSTSSDSRRILAYLGPAVAMPAVINVTDSQALPLYSLFRGE